MSKKIDIDFSVTNAEGELLLDIYQTMMFAYDHVIKNGETKEDKALARKNKRLLKGLLKKIAG